MKKVLAIAVLAAVIFTGCEVHPYADFAADFTRVHPFEEIQFTNLSDKAVYYEWDFGDGTYSTERSPYKYYTQEGIYQVSLTVESKDHNVDVAYMTIEVEYTLLEVIVAEWNPEEHIEFLVDGAFVIIYETLSDWENDINEVGYGYANNYGEILFDGLYDDNYYVWAERVPAYTDIDGYDNFNFYADGDYSYISTGILTPFVINEWIAWVDYFEVYESPNKAIKKNRHEKYLKENKIKPGDAPVVKVNLKKKK